jgi:hypothetical protein
MKADFEFIFINLIFLGALCMIGYCCLGLMTSTDFKTGELTPCIDKLGQEFKTQLCEEKITCSMFGPKDNPICVEYINNKGWKK